MSAEHSGWPYATNSPNKSDLEVDGEASVAYSRLRKGEKAEDIATSMGIGRATFYRRVARFAAMHDTPTTTYRRLAAEIELERLTTAAADLFESDASVDAKVKLLSELRMLNQSKRKLYAVDETTPEPVPPAPSEVPDEDWEAEDAS